MTGIKDDHFIILKYLTECKHFLHNEMMKAKYFHMECYVLKNQNTLKALLSSFNKHSQTLWDGGQRQEKRGQRIYKVIDFMV